jgi:hypothetical protein
MRLSPVSLQDLKMPFYIVFGRKFHLVLIPMSICALQCLFSHSYVVNE